MICSRRPRVALGIALALLIHTGCDGPVTDRARASLHSGYAGGGVAPAPAGAFPWVVSLRAAGEYQCTGSAIAPDLVVTANHCLDSVGLSIDEAFWGDLDRNSPSGRVFRVAPAVEGYRFSEHDVAVVRVTGEIVGGETVPGVGIPPPYARLPYHNGSGLARTAESSPEPGQIVAGWATFSSSGPALLTERTFLRHERPALVLDCARSFPPGVPADVFCLDSYVGNGLVLDGDSGGPVTSLPVATGERLLIGVISSSATDSSTGRYYDIFADLVGYTGPAAGSNPATLSHHFWYYFREPQAPQRAGRWERVTSCAPPLSDSRGYTASSWYETIQTADIDGDGAQDFVARQSDGLYWFQRSELGWVEHSAVVPLDDSLGFDSPVQYRSIQTADFDGDGRADVMAYFPGWALAIFRSDPVFAAAYAATPTIVLGQYADLGPMAEFRVADVNGDGRPDIVGAALPVFGGDGAFVVAENVSVPDDLNFEVHDAHVEGIAGAGVSRKVFQFGDVVLPFPSHHPYGAGQEMLLHGSDVADPDGFVHVYGWHDHQFVRLISGAPNSPSGPPPVGSPIECDYSSFADPTESQFTATFRVGRFFDEGCDGFIVRCPDGLRAYEPFCTNEYDAGIVEHPLGSPPPLRPTVPYASDSSVHIRDGWRVDTSFRTIQVGDVNGDGLDDFIARSPSGMLTYVNQRNGTFQPASVYIPPLTDAAGWDELSRAETISLVRLSDTDVADSLVARDACGISIYRFVRR